MYYNWYKTSLKKRIETLPISDMNFCEPAKSDIRIDVVAHEKETVEMPSSPIKLNFFEVWELHLRL